MDTDPVAIVLARRACRSGDARRLRESVGLTVRDVATALGVDPASVSRWERGLVRPMGDRARRLGALLAELDGAAEL